MNPSLVRGLPTLWQPSDPSTRKLGNLFGGQKVPNVGTPGPGPSPEPKTLEQRVSRLELENSVYKVAVATLAARVNALEERIS